MNELGILTQSNIKYLGVQLADTIDLTLQHTVASIKPKNIKKRILATTPPTDMLHRALLIKSAIIPLYNHIFMALPYFNANVKAIFDEILSFLWTRQVDGQTKTKRRQVSKQRIFASFSVGGLQIPDPEHTIQGFQMNFLQKAFNRQHSELTVIPKIIHALLNCVGEPSLEFCVDTFSHTHFEKIGNSLETHSLLVSQAFHSIALFLK